MKSNIRHIIRDFLINLILEDVDYDNLRQQSKKGNGFHTIYKKEAIEYMKVLQNKLGITPKRFLGSGHFGFAYLTTDNKTVKVTDDKSEVVEAKKWMDKNPEHLPKVFNVFKLKVNNGHDDIYVIVKEFILQNKNFISLLRETAAELMLYLKSFSIDKKGKFPGNLHLLYGELSDEQLSPEQIYEFMQFLKTNNAPKKVIWYMQQLYFLYEEMNSLGIQSTDTRPDNLGIKNKKLIFIDPGDGDSIGNGWIEKEPYTAELNE